MTRIRATVSLSAILAAAFVLSGCEVGSDTGGVRSTFGIDQGAPDEFLIIAKQPLQLPPTFDLPRPTPGAPNRVDPDPNAQAYSALYQGTKTEGNAPVSAGERVLLSGANAEGDNSSVRTALNSEEAVVTERKFLLDTFLGIPIPANIGEISSNLASVEEVERLRQQGLRTPAAPPAADDSSNSEEFSFKDGTPDTE
ncbi:MAG: DUF3035 domain-containing protein [Pikeienuella sp.]